MRDIEELRELRDYDAGAPPLDDATRRRMRARLLAVVAAGDGPAPAVRQRRPVPRRPVLRIALTGAVAAAMVGGVLVAGQVGRSGTGTGGGTPAMRNAAAQTVLHGAAAYARQHEEATGPRDDQFVYTKEIIRETNLRTGAVTSYTDEDWRSVDGSKPSWIMEIGKGWWAPPLAWGETEWPPAQWRELRKLPTDPRKLILSLVPGGEPGDPGTSLDGLTAEQWWQVHFALIGMLKLLPVMPEGLRPAAYDALGMVPGVTLVENQKDAEGRTGVAVTYDDPTNAHRTEGSGDSFVFDPKTYAYLGYRAERTTGKGAHKTEFSQFTYLDSWAVVDKAKQRP